MGTNRRKLMLALTVPILMAVMGILVGGSVWAQTVDFEAFWIRNNGSASENVHEDGANFVTPAGGDKAGYGTHFLDGQPLSSLQSIDWVKDHGSDTSIPYLNIWFTDGTNYAVAAPQHVGAPNYEYRASYVDISQVNVKVYEYENLDWMTPGTTTREGAGYLLNNGVRVTFGQLASYSHTIQDPGAYGSWVGTGAPKNGTGFNIIYGDTKSNYVGGYKIKYLVLNGITTAVPVTFIVNSDGTGDFTTIQDAIAAAYNGDSIYVETGDYEEQALIDKDLVLEGEPGASIKSPGSQTYTIAESSRIWDPIIFAYGGTMVGNHVSGPGVINADVKGLDIDGQNNAQAYPVRFVGIFYRNVDGEISGNTIHDMYDADGEGNGPETFGILVYGDSTVDILNNTISDYSRGGIAVQGDLGSAPDPVATVQGNTLIGNGFEAGTNWWADNGIQFGYGASGQISDNIVTGHWSNSRWGASGIIIVSTENVDILQNLVQDNELGIALAGYSVHGGNYTATNNVLVQDNDIVGNQYAISIQMDANNTTILENVISGNYSGISTSNYYGVEAVGTEAHYNSIVGNTYGFINWNVLADINATLNWWGAADGPSADLDQDGTWDYVGGGDAIWGNVIFSPWLGIDPDGNTTLPGVQITGPMLIIVDDVGPAPGVGYLNAAIGAANSANLPGTDTIEVRHGTYDASEPITQAVNIVSETGSASHTTLNGNMSINGNGVLIGLPLQGFRVNGDLTVGAGANAATSRINWCDFYGLMTNNGTGAFDARYNYWGTKKMSVIQARTTGAIRIQPYLPKGADESYIDIVAILNAGAAPNLTAGIHQLWRMDRMGLDVGTFIQYQGVAGAGALRATAPGAQINLGGAAGGGGAVEGVISGTYTIGAPIEGRFILTDPVTGEPITDAAVTLSLLGPDGSNGLAFWGCASYDETTGEYVFSIDTSGLAPGTYELIIQTDDGQSRMVSIEIQAV